MPVNGKGERSMPNKVADDYYLMSPQVRARYGGICATTLEEWMRNLDFPCPVILGGRKRMWLLSQLLRWEQLRQEQPAPPASQLPPTCRPHRARRASGTLPNEQEAG
jgi:predicted DNA-binding transcriptional regulator AlpA